jgi:YidC/Oxa1 family membrane protein insertase
VFSVHIFVGAFPVLGSTLGRIFQPLYQAMAWMLAGFYALFPNYAVAITLLTIVVMAASAPLTIKVTRSGLAMQRLQPELKKLQQKYKGDRVRLNQATVALYREHGVNPLSGFLPLLLQIPVLIVLYGVIRGLTHTVDRGRVAAPLYISHSVRLAKSLRAHPGQMHAVGINLASSLLGAHGSWVAYLPYAALVLIAIGLQYVQTRRVNSRTPQGSGTPQAQAQVLRYLPLVYAAVYLRFPAGVNIYFVASTVCRIAIQELALRPGSLRPSPGRRPRLAGEGET